MRNSILLYDSTVGVTGANHMLPIWIIILFAFYGPAISYFGVFRYVEVVVLIYFIANIRHSLRRIDRVEWWLIALFVLSAIMHVLSDMVNGGNVDNTIKRAFTYFLLAALVRAMNYIGRDNVYRILAVLLGYSLSSITQYLVGYGANPDFEINPWRLGIGANFTIGVCVVIALLPRIYKYAGFLLLLLSFLHFLLGARALSLISMLSGTLVLFGYYMASIRPFRISRSGIFRLFIAVTVGLSFVLLSAKLAYESNILPDELQSKFELQASNPYGLVAAARPETAAAIYGILQRPLLGYGTTNIDNTVLGLFAAFASESYVEGGESVYNSIMTREFESGTPSHSHLFGAWVQSGVLGALSWVCVFCLAVYVLIRAGIWMNVLAPLFIVVAMQLIWDILFSPGPHRMDMAIKIMVIIFAIKLYRSYDKRTSKLRATHMDR